MFAAQQAEYAKSFPTACHEIILVDGDAAGQIRWAELESDVHVIDVGILPSHRRRGAASAVYRRILTHARGAGKPVRCMVTRTNAPSVGFHHRLGFAIESESDTHYFLINR